MSETPNLGKIVEAELAALGALLEFADARERIVPELENILKRLKEENIG
jgi:hypothetical protein